MIKFSEYLDNQGKMEKTKISVDGDTGPSPTKAPEPAAKKGKNWKCETTLAEKPKDYATSTQPDKQMVMKDKDAKPGLGTEGDKKLIYEPETPTKSTADGMVNIKPTWPKATEKTTATAESFINATKDMSTEEFVAYLSETKEKEEHPLKTIINAVRLMKDNDKLTETFVRETRRQGSLDILVNEMFKLEESYKGLATLLSDISHQNRLNDAIKESTEAPASETEGEDKKAVGKRKAKSIKGQPMDMGNDVVSSKASMSNKK